ncbi:unnamed protein product [Urochloa humidicola]
MDGGRVEARIYSVPGTWMLASLASAAHQKRQRGGLPKAVTAQQPCPRFSTIWWRVEENFGKHGRSTVSSPSICMLKFVSDKRHCIEIVDYLHTNLNELGQISLHTDRIYIYPIEKKKKWQISVAISISGIHLSLRSAQEYFTEDSDAENIP